MHQYAWYKSIVACNFFIACNNLTLSRESVKHFFQRLHSSE